MSRLSKSREWNPELAGRNARGSKEWLLANCRVCSRVMVFLMTLEIGRNQWMAFYAKVELYGAHISCQLRYLLKQECRAVHWSCSAWVIHVSALWGWNRILGAGHRRNKKLRSVEPRSFKSKANASPSWLFPLSLPATFPEFFLRGNIMNKSLVIIREPWAW